jgi:hypothetical protein
MRFASSLALVLGAALVLAVAPAQATVTCGVPVDNGAGQVDITVTTDATFVTVSAQGGDTGQVTETVVSSDDAPFNSCGVGDASCTFSLQGTGGVAQTWTRSFDDTGSSATPCTVTEADGLPVELLSFSVE